MLAMPALAQDAAGPPAPEPVVPDAIAPAATTLLPDYAIPDFDLLTRYIPSIHTKFGSAVLGLELIGDWSSFNQDAASLAQVGEQNSQFQVRSAGVDITGQLGPRPEITYKVGLQYNGFNTNADQAWTVTDLAVNFDLKRWQTRIKIGQIKGMFSYEVAGSFVKMPQSERTMSPFAAPRNPGITATHAIGRDKRMTVSLSTFKDQSESAGGSFGVSARATALVWGAPGDGNGYLHLGLSALRSGADSAARYRAQPGSDVADFYVDTGEFAVNGASHVGLEALYSNVGGWSVMSEYVVARVDSVDYGNVGFRGFYVLGSWVMTGEFRPYDRDTGVAGRLEPKGRWGAPELVARYSMVDLDDGPIQGGRYDRIEVGVNWWATTRWKLGILAGRVWLDRDGVTGVTNTVLTRLQWVY
jgi:phosphate-selective porin OprO/OprP